MTLRDKLMNLLIVPNCNPKYALIMLRGCPA